MVTLSYIEINNIVQCNIHDIHYQKKSRIKLGELILCEETISINTIKDFIFPLETTNSLS